MKIEKGKKYKCIETYMMHDKKIAYIEGGIYTSHEDCCLKSDVIDNHKMSYETSSEHFIIYEEAEKPAHYQNKSNYDVIDFCNDYKLNFNRGSACKYIARAGKKDDEIKDLKKAIDFLEREIKFLENEK